MHKHIKYIHVTILLCVYLLCRLSTIDYRTIEYMNNISINEYINNNYR